MLLHEKTPLLRGSRTGPSILTGTIFNQMKWYVDHSLVRKLHFSTTTLHTTTLFAAYEDLLHELHPSATAAEMCWDYLKLEVPQKRAVERVLDDGSWTPGDILEDLPKRSMKLYLRCRYVPADKPTPLRHRRLRGRRRKRNRNRQRVRERAADNGTEVARQIHLCVPGVAGNTALGRRAVFDRQHPVCIPSLVLRGANQLTLPPPLSLSMDSLSLETPADPETLKSFGENQRKWIVAQAVIDLYKPTVTETNGLIPVSLIIDLSHYPTCLSGTKNKFHPPLLLNDG